MREQWIRRLDLWEEPIPGRPLVEILGRNQVLIEQHCGVTEYGQCVICVSVKHGSIRVCGSHLELARMTREMLVITGRIDHVQLEGGDCFD